MNISSQTCSPSPQRGFRMYPSGSRNPRLPLSSLHCSQPLPFNRPHIPRFPKANISLFPDKTFLDMRSAGRICGISVRQIRRMIEDNDLPYVELGRKHFIVRSHLLRWLRSLPVNS